jgi:autotransporter-associated beta strand protein
MKPKSIRRIAGPRSIRPLALVTTLTAFAAGSASATQYTWLGTTDSNWSTASNWNANGVAQTNGTFVHRLNVTNLAANSSKPATYNFPGVTTTYTGNAASGSRGLVIGSGGANAGITGTMLISGGTFSTIGGVGADIIGNGTGNSGTLTIDGTTNGGDAHFTGISLGISLGLGLGSTATLNVKNGSATLFDLTTNNTTATINLETGGTLAMNRLVYSGSGNNIINLDGGTLKARTPTTSFIATPSSGTTTLNVKTGGAIVDTAGSNISIARPFLADAGSPGGGITKNGTGVLTLGAVSTTTGSATVNAGGLVVPAGATSWQPSSFSHSGSSMGFNIGVYNSSNAAPISTGNATFSTPVSVSVTGSQFIVSQIPLLAYSGTFTGFSNLTLDTASLPPGVLATLENNNAGLIYLNVTQGGFVWSGASATPGSGDWDTASSNWNAFASAYTNLAPVTFPSISGGGTVNLTTDVSPVTADFINTTGDDYILTGTGKITGASAVNKTGNGTVSLNNTNDYTGNTTVTSGILSIASTASLPGWNANSRYPVSSGATLAVQNAVSDAEVSTMLATTGNFASGSIIGFDTTAGNRTYSSNLTGALGVATVGSNILTLAGTNTHTGSTLVAGGTLRAGSSTAFTGTGPLVMRSFTTFDLGGFDTTFTTTSAGTLTSTITDGSAVVGTSTLTLTSGGASFTGPITDGSTRKVAVKCRAGNASNVPNNADSTYSGGLTLLGGIDSATNGTRLLPYDTFTTIDPETGLITSGPYGTGPITIGQTAADKVQVYFQAGGRTIANNIIINTAVGTDTAGTFRVESGGNFLSGAIVANEATAFFRNNVTGGSAGSGDITLTGPISTGSNPAAGLTVTAAGANPLALTLKNQTAVANNYTGSTTVTGANATLILGAANQIPNGSGAGNVTVTSGKLDLAGFNETLNGLNGTGTVDNVSTGTANTLTIGDGNASGSFSGAISNTNGELALVKVGSGIQTITGINSYTGPTTVRGGTLAVNSALDSATVTVGGATATGSPTLTGGGGTINGTLLVAAAGGGAAGTVNPGSAGTVGSLNVSETTIAGTYACDVVSADADVLFVNGDLNLTGATFALNTVTPVGGTYTIATYSGTLSGTFTPSPALPSGASLDYGTAGEIRLILPAPSGFEGWITGFGLNANDQDPTDDPDHDGISNLMEYVLFNGQPAVSSTSILPTLDASGSNFIFTLFRRTDSAVDTTQIFQYGTSLSSWTDVAIPGGAGVTVTPNDPSPGIDRIVISVLRGSNSKLFGRLNVTKP